MLVVTGAAGFIGRHVVAAARAQGQSVVTVDRRTAGDDPTDFVVDLAEPARRSRALAALLASADAVIHLAGRGGVRTHGVDVDRWRYRDNLLAARTVLQLAPQRIPVVVTSSSSVYGGTRPGRPSGENDRLRPLSGYAVSKRAVERECHQRAGWGGRVTVARPFTVVGKGQRSDMALARWVDQGASNRPLTVIGDLGRSRDLTDVGDIARALLRLAELAPQTTINLGSGVPVTLRAMMAVVKDHLGDHGVHYVASSEHEPDHTLADVTRCHELLGFAPRSPDLDATVVALVEERSISLAPVDGVA